MAHTETCKGLSLLRLRLSLTLSVVTAHAAKNVVDSSAGAVNNDGGENCEIKFRRWYLPLKSLPVSMNTCDQIKVKSRKPVGAFRTRRSANISAV